MKGKSFLLLTAVLLLTLFVTTACAQSEMKSKKGYDYLVLVNKYSRLPDDWEKNVELVETKNAWNEKIKIEKYAYEQYKKLAEELKSEGVTIELDSVYRSVKEQQELWDEWSKDPEKGPDYVKKYVAVPGYSEHHTGLAVDICLKKGKEIVSDNDDMIADTKTFAKIHKKLAKYGFILRYLKGRDDVTGYAYEPWHLRYVGDTKVAEEIMDKNITFEEYLDSIEDLKSNHEAAKYKIEKTLKKYLEEDAYKDQISDSRFDVTKIYTDEEIEKNEALKSLKLNKKDIPFEVTYQLKPAKGVKPITLMVVDGEYNEELEWVTDISRLGVLKYDSKNKKYTIENFGTGW